MVQKEQNEAKDRKEERQAYGDWIFFSYSCKTSTRRFLWDHAQGNWFFSIFCVLAHRQGNSIETLLKNTKNYNPTSF